MKRTFAGIRADLGMTQQELADYLGIARMTYVRYEAYERMMPVDLFLRIADLAKIEDVRTIRFK